MVQIIASIVAAVAYFRAAEAKDYNGFGWAVIGVAAMLIPGFIWGLLMEAILPGLLGNTHSQGAAIAAVFFVTGAGIALGTGTTISIYRRFLKSTDRPLTPRVEQHTAPVKQTEPDPYVSACLDIDYEEREDARWFSSFDELPEVDLLRESGRKEEALRACLEGLKRYPDSFLFYTRGASLYDELGRPAEAKSLLMQGMQKSLSKCSIARTLADRALDREDHRESIRWWITAGVLQLDSGIMVDKMPFLSLAYVCHPASMKETEHWLLSMADRASNEGTVRLSTEGARLRHRLARRALLAEDRVVFQAIKAFQERYQTSAVSREVKEQ